MDLSSTNETSVLLWKANSAIYGGLDKVCTKTSAGRLLALPVTVATDFLSFGVKITNIGESAFKGLANIIAAPFTSEASALRGVKQLGGTVAKIAVLPLYPIRKMLTNPFEQLAVVAFGANYAKLQQQEYTKKINHSNDDPNPIFNMDLHDRSSSNNLGV